MKVAFELVFELEQERDGRLRHNRLHQHGLELLQNPPAAWLGQAAASKRGESSNSLTSGSSTRIINK
jgi:hypothetical protein